MKTIRRRKSITQKHLSRERRGRLPDVLKGLFLLLYVLAAPSLLSGRHGSGLFPLSFFLGAAFLFLGGCGAFLLARALSRFPYARSEFGAAAQTQQIGMQNLWDVLDEIDEDIAQGCRRFGPLTVGSAWIVGEGPMRMSLVCGVFPVTVARVSHVLCLADCQNHIQATSILRLSDMNSAIAYLRLCLPGVRFGEKLEDYLSFLHTEPERRRQLYPTAADCAETMAALRAVRKFTLLKTDGDSLCEFHLRDLEEQMAALSQPGQRTGLTLTYPVSLPAYRAVSGLFAEPARTMRERKLIVTYRDGADTYHVSIRTGAAQALDAMRSLYLEGRFPRFSAWEGAPQREVSGGRPGLRVDGCDSPCASPAGVDDAVRRLTNGSCRSFSLTPPDKNRGGLFFLRKRGDYVAVAAVMRRTGRVRWYETRTRRQDQIRLWAHSYYLNDELPYLSGWKKISPRAGLVRPQKTRGQKPIRRPKQS